MENPVTGGPLRGLRVLELAAIGPAPFACMLLADLGADVVRIDRPGVPRAFGDWHRVLDRGRRSIALDLKDPADVRTVLRLVERSDVLVEGFRPGVTERLGLGPADCLARNPGLVYGRMTGWGQDGPLASAPGHDINYLALSGALAAIGEDGGPPVPPLNLLGDFAGGGLPLAFGIMAALYERRASGLGQVVDAAITDGTASMLGMLSAMLGAGSWRSERGRNVLDGGAPHYGVYRCADGGYVAVGALEDRFYRCLLTGLGLSPQEVPDRSDQAAWPALRGVFAARFATRTRDEWARHFEGTDACVTPVLSLAEAARHPHQRARGTYREVDGVIQPAPMPRFSRTPAPGHRPPGRPADAPTTPADAPPASPADAPPASRVDVPAASPAVAAASSGVAVGLKSRVATWPSDCDRRQP
ncbi:CoA transferase [Streptomyces durbertensis]|uniref:CoA transferase n=1 Tax=Streptomyces durbertensis TaxID=2448886 RepID=A0ABR6EA25_9ACTN|nr:CaiB/BaiF CoA-transferase family protein [Streptomyces durbertensis]MBB1242197.1 CoA transferase [Streptomyces durbertensis]